MSVFESERLYLRALEPEDLVPLYVWENDSDLWRYGSSLRPYSKFELAGYLADSVRDITETRQMRLMAVEKSTGQAVGAADFYDYDPVNLRAGVGIVVDAPLRGKGFGREILDILQRYASQILHLHCLYACIPVSNAESLKLFADAGYLPSGTLQEWIRTATGYEDVRLMQLLI
jgi:diamine N-acetyltransferase